MAPSPWLTASPDAWWQDSARDVPRSSPKTFIFLALIHLRDYPGVKDLSPQPNPNNQNPSSSIRNAVGRTVARSTPGQNTHASQKINGQPPTKIAKKAPGPKDRPATERIVGRPDA